MALVDQLLDAFQPWMTPDLNVYLTVLGEMFAEYEEFAAEQPDGTPGWVILFDPDRCPVKALPFTAQIVGERLPVGISEAEARQWIKDAPNQVRGTTSAICARAKRGLTGAQTALYRTRTKLDGTSDADYLQVATLAGETPNPAQTLQNILAVSPADIHVDYRQLSNATWADINLGYATWADVKAANATWADVYVAVAGWTTCGAPPSAAPGPLTPPVIS